MVTVNKKKPEKSGFFLAFDGGEDEDRTHDLLIANQALSQLSYPPQDWNNLTRIALLAKAFCRDRSGLAGAGDCPPQAVGYCGPGGAFR